jgi:hypothetical protein
MMVDASLLEYERDVEQSRARLTRDLAVLCSPETFASFTDDLKQEAFETKDALFESLSPTQGINPCSKVRSPTPGTCRTNVALWGRAVHRLALSRPQPKL